MRPHQFCTGDKVRLHPIIGGNHDGKTYRFGMYAGRHGTQRKLHAVITNERGQRILADVEGLSRCGSSS